MKWRGVFWAALLVAAASSFKPRQALDARVLGRRPASAFHHRGHSHNDYLRVRPLEDALEQGFRSVEADVWLTGDSVRVSHLGWIYDGTLAELYLDPLEARVRARGSVLGDGEPFLLWLDLKSPDRRLGERLREVLGRYEMFRRGAVTAVLTGASEPKRAYFSGASGPAGAIRDSLRFDPDDPTRAGPEDPWGWYSLSWSSLLDWDGAGEAPAEQLARLRERVGRVHAKGRKLRIWGGPDRPEAWRAQLDAGVDLVGTDSPEDFVRAGP